MGNTWVDPDCGNPELGPPLVAGYPSFEAPDTYIRETTIDNAESCSYPSGYNPGNVLQHDKQLITVFASASHNFNESLRAAVELNYGRERIDETDVWGDGLASSWAVPPILLGTDFAIPGNESGALIRARSLNPGFGVARGMSLPVYMEAETLPFGAEVDAYTRTDLFRAAFSLDGALSGSWEWHADVQAAYYEARNALRDMLKANLPLALNGYGGPDCGVADLANPGPCGGRPGRLLPLQSPS